MGSGFLRHFAAYEKKIEGWFGGCNLVSAPAGGTFNIRPLETASNNVQGVRVPVAAALCPSGLSPCEYAIEYRQPLGFDARNGGTSGVLVRVVSKDLVRNSYLLDMTPQTATLNDAALAVGTTFQDPNGVTIAVTVANATAATVAVTVPGAVGQATCLDGSLF
jgi:hypothetical protein